VATLSVIRKPNSEQLGPVLPAEVIVLCNEKTMIGRRQLELGIDLQLPAFFVNRQHALVTRLEGAYWIDDLASRNGTFLNNTLLRHRARLSDGDQIRITDYVLLFRDDVTSSQVDPVHPASGA
jgi:pSer/pThr/pTyr-binding forkhead associated (FHA) protein